MWRAHLAGQLDPQFQNLLLQRIDSQKLVAQQQAVQLAQQPGNTNQGIASDLGISQSALSSTLAIE